MKAFVNIALVENYPIHEQIWALTAFQIKHMPDVCICFSITITYRFLKDVQICFQLPES